MMESKVLKKMNAKQKARAKKEAAEEAYYKGLEAPKTTFVELAEYEWIEDENLLYQVIEIGGVTANSKVDLQPTAYQILELQNNDIAFILENDDGVVTAYCLGGRPNKSYTMQVLITEVVPV